MENHNEQENSITLNDLIGLVKKNILLIGLITFGVFLIGVFYTFKIVKPIYKSTTSVIVAIENQSNNADQNVDYTNSLRIIETVATYTKENVVLEPVAKKHNMSTNELKGMIETSTSTTKYIYTISISSENAELAGILVNEIYSSLEKQIDNNEAIKKFKVTVSQTSPALDGVYSKPNKKLYLIISLLFGGIIAFIVVFIKEFLSNKYKNKNEIENTINEKILAVFRNDKKNKEKEVVELVSNDMQSLEPYNKLATNIKYNNLENPYKAILITSTVMDELKSTICCNLAYSLAINKKKVCVVDLDLRKPVMHKVFKISKENGIVEYVDGSITKEELIKHTESGVDVITAGKNAFNTLVILEHSKLKTLIEELKKEYDYVLLDTTPVVATDSLVAAKLVDGIIYNIAINTAKKKNIQESIKTVKTIGNTIIGIVVTKAYLDSNDKYYYNYYKSND